jgi:hypothetical protein
MKEILITPDRQKTELFILLASFIGAISLNILGIIIYHTEWKELYSQWFIILIITVVIYFIVLFLRLLFLAITLPLRRKKNG